MAGTHPILQAAVLVGSAGKREDVLTQTLLGIAGRTLWADNVSEATALADRFDAELVILTEDVQPAESLAFLQRMKVAQPRAAVVVVSKSPDVDLAVRVVRAGAYDFIAGGLDQERLRRLVEGVRAERAQATEERSRFFCDECPLGVEIVGHSPGIVHTLEKLRLVSESRCNPILLLGETGTGKELAARAVHAWRCGNPEAFVAVNCAGLTANLLESELFGHVKGAFTGAEAQKTGLFELAGSGTILLDEIGEMPSPLQAKLLRVLQERKFRKVGGVDEIPCSATLIATSNRNLLAEMEAGRFRGDLYYRLAVFPIIVPPLRAEQRREDIPLLAEYFAGVSGVAGRRSPRRLSAEARRKLLAHAWPGNVRELRNVVERALITRRDEEITPDSLVIEPAQPARPMQEPGEAHKPRDGDDFSLVTAERELIVRALKETGWQRTRAAALLGITRATLHAKLKRYDIRPPSPKRQPSDTEAPEQASAEAERP